jgi:hypothetical protein
MVWAPRARVPGSKADWVGATGRPSEIGGESRGPFAPIHSGMPLWSLVARGPLLLASTLDAEVAQGSPKNTSYLVQVEAVAKAVHRHDVLRHIGLRFDLAPQLDDEVINRAVGRARIHPPHPIQNLFTAHRLTGAFM